MNNNVEIMNTLHYKHNLEEQLNNMICGSVEIREKDKKNIFMYTIESLVEVYLSMWENIVMICII